LFVTPNFVTVWRFRPPMLLVERFWQFRAVTGVDEAELAGKINWVICEVWRNGAFSPLRKTPTVTGGVFFF
jgi:hypothetical protein